MKEEKLKQLRTIFRKMIRNVIFDSKALDIKKARENYINTIANQLVYEVKFRINNK